LAEDLIITSAPRADHQLDLTIQLGPERTEKALQRAIQAVSRKAKIPGFRPGKAPAATILRLHGREAVLSEIADDLGQEVYKEVLDAKTFDPYGQASLVDVTLDPIAFKLIVPLAPSAELGDYANLRVDAPAASVSDADVDALLEQARKANMVVTEVARPAEIGDIVRVDIKGAVGEDSIMDNEDWELTLREESGWLPGFNQAFVGLAAGEQKAFDLTYPETSASRFKGQLAHFDVMVKAVQAKSLPEATDELVKTLGDYADVADFRAQKLAELTTQREKQAADKLTDDAVEALAAQATLAYPPAVVDDAVAEMIRDMETRLSNIGYALKDSLRLQGKTLEGYRDELRPVAEKRVRGRLALAELAERAAVTVTDEDVQAELARMTSEAQDEAAAKAMRDVFGSEAGQRIIRQDLVTDKTLALLRQIVTGQAVVAAEA
jgi:trigger factor